MKILSLITFLPVFGALLTACIPGNKIREIRLSALLFSITTLLATLWMWFHLDTTAAEFQFLEKASWISSLNVRYILGVDGLSAPLVVLTALLSTISIIASFHIEHRTKEYFVLLLVLETAMLGVFLSLDLFLFYVFWEMSSVPIFFLVGIWGGPNKKFAALKFFLVTLFGSLFMLGAILSLYWSVTPHTFDYAEILKQSGSLARNYQLFAFGALFIAFAIKMPVFPFHTWLPLAHVEAPTAVSALLAGVLLKIGSYGLMRYSFTLFPLATQTLAGWLGILAFINIVYGAFCSLAQTDIKRMIAYSSINHMGYVLLGMASLNIVGFQGSVVQMVNHGVITGCLFFLIGALYDRTHTRDMKDFGGLAPIMPVFTGLMMVASFASLGMPLLSGFVGEFLCFLGAFQEPKFRWITLLSLLGLLLTAAFFINFIRRVFWGPTTVRWASLPDLNPRELMTAVPLTILMVVLGLHPGLLLIPMNETLVSILGLAKRVVP